MRPLFFAILATGLLLRPTCRAQAQEFRVYTRIYDVRGTSDAGSRAPVGRSTALFHAGKVYDCVDTGNQMTIYEPALERFVMIDGSRRVAAVVRLDAIETLLHQAAKKGEEQLETLRGSSRRDDIQLANHLEFQLAPRFEVAFDEAKQILRLNGRAMSYSVRCAAADPADLVDKYLDYADWAARLNYVMNPAAQLPLGRLQLNEALRSRQRIPTEVTLKTHQPGGLHLTAEHRFDWKIDASDREIIRHWEKLLHDNGVKRVSLKDYRRGVLEAPEADRR
jgi:hypothetical protein